MKTIFKYDLPDAREFSIQMPFGAQILHVGAQDNKGKIWALVSPEGVGTETRRFSIFDTGEYMHHPDGVRRYIGTFHIRMYDGSPLVNHLFEILIYDPPL